METLDRSAATLGPIPADGDVYSADDAPIGKIVAVQAGFVIAELGMFLPTSLSIPVAAVGRVEGSRVYLAVPKEAIAAQGWEVLPDAGPEATPPAAGADGTTTMGPRTDSARPFLTLRAEEPRPRTSWVIAGEVVLRQRVVTERRLVEVQVRREELVVERREFGEGSESEDEPPEREPEGAVRTLGEGETVTILLREEELRIQKVPVVVEEVRISKRVVEETRPVTTTVQREVLRVEREGDASVREFAGPTSPG